MKKPMMFKEFVKIDEYGAGRGDSLPPIVPKALTTNLDEPLWTNEDEPILIN